LKLFHKIIWCAKVVVFSGIKKYKLSI